MTTFKTKPCGDYDAESVTLDSQRGHLILADGLDSEVFDIAPGPNGIFDSCPPYGDDQATHFDTARLGIADPEGVAYNPDHHTIYITGAEATKVIEMTITGDLVTVFDISSLKINNPSGLAYAPSSVNPAVKTLYICARGKDNDTEPDENDGKIYEIALAPLPTLTPTPTSMPTPTPRPRPSSRRIFLPYLAE
jgi:DNA-binding beta-propeller fold protein YncE